MSLKQLRSAVSAFALAVFLSAGGVHSAPTDKMRFDIPSQPLKKALFDFSEQTHIVVLLSETEIDDLESNSLSGSYSPEEALHALLRNRGVTYEYNSADSTLTINGKTSSVENSTNDASPHNSDNKGASRRKRDLEVEEIIVTAQKREQSLMDVPMSIAAMSNVELEERKISNIEDLGFAVPGLTISGDNSYNRRVSLRGITNNSGSSSLVGIYLDEASITGGHAYQQLDVRIHDLERVEVLRGPQGTLYGEGSMGGTIRFITKDPQLDRFSTKADISASFTEDGSPGQKIQGVLNVPIIEDVFGLRISGTFEHSGGWIDQPAAAQRDINDYNLSNVRIKSLWQASEAMQIKATAIIHRNDLGAPDVGEDEDGNFTQMFGLQVTGSSEDEYELYNLVFTYDFDSIQFLSTSSYINTEKKVMWYGNQVQNLPPPLPPFDILSGPLDTTTDIFNQEVRLSSTDSGPWNWTIGGSYRDTAANFLQVAYFGIYEPGDPLPAPLTFSGKNTYETWAAFGDISYAFTDRFEVGIGLRYFSDDQEQIDLISNVSQIQSFNSLTQRFYLNYDLSENSMAYISVSEGFRSGGFNQPGQPTFEPESLWVYEIGTKMVLLDGSLDAEFALYYSDYQDYLVNGIPPPPALPLSRISNGGDVEIKGIDWSLNWHATDSLSLEFSSNYNHSEFTEIRVLESTSSNIPGDRLSEAPKYSFTLSANYDFSWDNKPGYLRLDYNQRGRSIYRSRSIGPHSFSSSDVNNLLNFRLGLDWSENLFFGIFARNLLNDRGLLNARSILGQTPRNRPRTFGLELGVQFD